MSDLKSILKATSVAMLGASSMTGYANETQVHEPEQTNVVQSKDKKVSHENFFNKLNDFMNGLDEKNKLTWDKVASGMEGIATVKTGDDTLTIIKRKDLDGKGNIFSVSSEKDPEINFDFDSKGMYKLRDHKSYTISNGSITKDPLVAHYYPADYSAKIEGKIEKGIDNYSEKEKTLNLAQAFMMKQKLSR